MMKGRTTLILTRSDVAELLSMTECIDAVEAAFRAHAEGRAWGPAVASVHVKGGGFHVKAAGLALARPWFAAKTNGNFFHNDRLGLPRIQGMVALCDASNGVLVALLDSIEITTLRTAATTAVAARHLARPDSRSLALIGCGVQGHASLRAIAECFSIERVCVVDLNPHAAGSLSEAAEELGATPTVCLDPSDAVRAADICVTSTPSTEPILTRADLHPGLFVAAVGADSDRKQELAPDILHGARVVVDDREQAATIGEVHHAIDERHSVESIIDATLGDVIAGAAPGRVHGDEVIVFDSTGTALQDVAAAVIVFEKAVQSGRGLSIDLKA